MACVFKMDSDKVKKKVVGQKSFAAKILQCTNALEKCLASTLIMRCFCANQRHLIPFRLSWKKTVSAAVPDFLSGGANRADTCKTLHKPNWRKSNAPSKVLPIILIVRRACVPFWHERTLTNFSFRVFDDEGKERVCFANPGFPDSSAMVERLMQSKEKESRAKRKDTEELVS